MSEKLQHTAATTRRTMLHRYDDGFHHKHNKSHLPYRQHCRSHIASWIKAVDDVESEKKVRLSTGRIREQNLQKIRKRIVDKGRFH